MSYSRCLECGEYDWLDKHRCPPRWTVYEERDTEEDALVIRARSAESAAEKWAERYDQDAAEGIICGGRREPVVIVKRDGEETVRLSVVGYLEPTYSARPAPPASPPAGEGEK